MWSPFSFLTSSPSSPSGSVALGSDSAGSAVALIRKGKRSGTWGVKGCGLGGRAPRQAARPFAFSLELFFLIRGREQGAHRTVVPAGLAHPALFDGT